MSIHFLITARSVTIGAYEVIRGKYKDTETLPDDDLGKSITPGFRNLALTVREKKIYVLSTYLSIYLPTVLFNLKYIMMVMIIVMKMMTMIIMIAVYCSLQSHTSLTSITLLNIIII